MPCVCVDAVYACGVLQPTPLYVMDEIDAALDFKNVSIVANYIKERTKNAQFIIISLRNNMFELADRLIGIYKTHDVTKSVAINPKEIGAFALPVPAAAARAPRPLEDTLAERPEPEAPVVAGKKAAVRATAKKSALPL